MWEEISLHRESAALSKQPRTSCRRGAGSALQQQKPHNDHRNGQAQKISPPPYELHLTWRLLAAAPCRQPTHQRCPPPPQTSRAAHFPASPHWKGFYQNKFHLQSCRVGCPQSEIERRFVKWLHLWQGWARENALICHVKTLNPEVHLVAAPWGQSWWQSSYRGNHRRGRGGKKRVQPLNTIPRGAGAGARHSGDAPVPCRWHLVVVLL